MFSIQLSFINETTFTAKQLTNLRFEMYNCLIWLTCKPYFVNSENYHTILLKFSAKSVFIVLASYIKRYPSEDENLLSPDKDKEVPTPSYTLSVTQKEKLGHFFIHVIDIDHDDLISEQDFEHFSEVMKITFLLYTACNTIKNKYHCFLLSIIQRYWWLKGRKWCSKILLMW